MSARPFVQNFSWKGSIQSRSSNSRRSERWAIILAGGDGTRLQSMTRAISGDDRPKQFVPVIGGSTLLEQTRSRVALSVLPGRTMFVVTEKHRRFYELLAHAVSPNLILEQPENKGTAPAILYALMRVAAKSPRAIVALFPSDHYFADDEDFMEHVDVAFNAVQAQPAIVTLLGITPTAPETEYGWIEPQRSILGSAPRSITRVNRFWEKPDPSLARVLLESGCLWNSFVMVSRVDALLKMTRTALPELYSQFSKIHLTFETPKERQALRELYLKIPETNFSHQVLAHRPQDLTVLKVGDVGWSDLGEPSRVLSTLARIGIEKQLAMPAS
ncbi:MAG TPA: sugar phosphate nucleotidyltransferase [Pyrinomonadaceae bacterium]|nr:sugar phosphate nucleotidyltransferase [Pyrinomonadaceae bacterium]